MLAVGARSTEGTGAMPTDLDGDDAGGGLLAGTARFVLLRYVLYAIGLLAILLIPLGSDGLTHYLLRVGYCALLAGASAMIGGLIGLLFGIPRRLQATDGEGEGAASGAQGRLYGGNTNLEQISDWLTKILVGVGLTQLSGLGEAVGRIGEVAASGLPGHPGAEVFAICIVLYFGVGGFILGYLWTRLYLGRALSEAERAQTLERKVAELRKGGADPADVRARALVRRQIEAPPERRPTQAELDAAMQAATSEACASIWNDVQFERYRASLEDDPDRRRRMAERTVPVFRALIAADPDERFHANWGQLGLALALMARERDDWREAEAALTRAIEIREAGGRGVGRYHRARARVRIELDREGGPLKASDEAAREAIRADVDAALGEGSDVLADAVVTKWLELNGLAMDRDGRTVIAAEEV
jgi:hypothetical protein